MNPPHPFFSTKKKRVKVPQLTFFFKKNSTPHLLVCVLHGVAVSVGGVGVEVDLIATHFSFFPSSTTATSGFSSDFSFSSSEVTLSSVSASTPVVVSDSEELEDEVASEVVVSTATVAAGVGSVGDEVATEESLFAAAAASFFACLTRSLFSIF